MADDKALPPQLESRIAAGRVVPFLGAGISRNAGLPDWPGLLRGLITWAANTGIPLARPQLVLDAIDKGHFDRAAHALGEALGEKLTEGLRTIIAPPGIAPTLTHRLLANVNWAALITTNFDNLVPESVHGWPILTWQDQEAIGNTLKSGDAHVMMAHGWIERPKTIVLTPQEYRDSFRTPALQNYMKTLLSQNSFLFLGFSLNDYDLNLFLEELRHAFGPTAIPHFALLAADRINELDIRHYRDNYGIEVITYAPTDMHAEVEDFVSLVIDHVPQSHLRNPLVQVEKLKAMQDIRVRMSAGEYLKRFQDTCQRLAESGFLRTAWTALSGELQSAIPSISITQRIETTIAIMEMRIADHAIDLAYQPMREVLPLTTRADVDRSLKLQFEAVMFRLCLEGYLLADARQSLERAQNLGIWDPAIERMAAELEVADFLHGGPCNQASKTDNPGALAARAEAAAMRGHLEDALAQLDGEAEGRCAVGSANEAAWLRVKRAELLFMNCAHEEAWDEFERIKALEPSLSLVERTTYERNRSLLAAWLGRADTNRELAVVTDQEPTTRQDAGYLRDLVTAEEASRERRHYESLPLLWRDLLRAYREAAWSVRQRAHHRLAWEALAAGWVWEAVHHTIVGANHDCGRRLVDQLISWRSRQHIDEALKYILERCFLTAHIQLAAEILALAADIIPGDDLKAVIEWILGAVARPVGNSRSGQCTIAAWKAARSLAFRLSEDNALAVLGGALANPLLHTRGWERRAIVETIEACIGRIRSYNWRDLATTIIPLATTERWDGDYPSVLRLLRQVATKSTDARSAIADVLLPPGTASRDFRVAPLASELGRKVEAGSLRMNLAAIANRLPLQVWTGTGDPPPFELSMLMSQQIAHAGETTRIMIFGGSDQLEFVVAHKNNLPDAEWAALFGAVLGLIAHPLNVRANRIMLIDFVARMYEQLTPAQTQAAVDCIRKFADGTAPTSLSDLPSPATTDRMQWHAPTSEELQATALRAIAKIAIRAPASVECDELIKHALLHNDPLLRQAACYAITDLPQRTPALELLLVTAVQDRDVRVAAAALDVATSLYERGALLNVTGWLVALAERSFTSPEPAIRCLSTRLAGALQKGVDDETQKAILAGILTAAKTDLHYTVRCVAD